MSSIGTTSKTPPRSRPQPSHPTFHRFAWSLVAYNLAVVAWGAFVRATGSGAGCGNHWPLCNGEVVPRAPATETLIEFSHRLTSGLDGLLVIALLIAAFRLYPARHRVRWGALACLVFLVVEALVGAGLVRFDLVADDASGARAVVMGVHLINTFLLLASLALTAVWAGGARGPRLSRQGTVGWLLGLSLAGLLVLGVSGAVTALGDTLFPAHGFGWEDLSPASHYLIRLRILHPTIALVVAALVVISVSLIRRLRPVPEVRRAARALVGLYTLGLVAGLVNVALKAPVWMQLVHLLIADLVWIAFVVLAAGALAEGAPEEARDRLAA